MKQIKIEFEPKHPEVVFCGQRESIEQLEGEQWFQDQKAEYLRRYPNGYFIVSVTEAEEGNSHE